MNCIYFSYDGLLDPLGQSQVIPYIKRLVAVGHSFTVLSYEKEQRSPDEILALERSLNLVGIEWLRLPFRTGKVEFAKRIISGIFAVRRVCGRKRPTIIHLRGFIPAVIFKLALLRVPHLYDFRSFAVEEWGDIGKLRSGSFPHQILRKLDHSAVENACGLVVLEESAEALLRKTYKVPNVPLKVIRTCTDVSLYRLRNESNAHSRRGEIAFVYLGGAIRPYRPDLALRLVSHLLKVGVDCRIDFINERDHAEIQSAACNENFPADRIKLLKLYQGDVPAALENYDCGLVLLDTSPWRRVCSPTKLGEYFAAGLPVVSTEGIDVLEEFSGRTSCVEIIKQEELLKGVTRGTVDRLISFIHRPGIGVACQELAHRECSLELAGRLYTELYAEIEAKI